MNSSFGVTVADMLITVRKLLQIAGRLKSSALLETGKLSYDYHVCNCAIF